MIERLVKNKMPRTQIQNEEIREERKKQIIHSGLELFANNGFHNTSISQIAKQAKISKGLMYNYFSGKGDLLKTIFCDIMENVMDKLNPNHDNEIDDNEVEDFVDNMFNIVIESPRDWKLYFQLMMQHEVMEFLMSENLMDKFAHNQKILFDYFADREFDDPIVDILHFSSVYKGFALQYVFAPELFNNDDIERFKNRIKQIFVKPKREKPNPNIQLDESIGYLLM